MIGRQNILNRMSLFQSPRPRSRTRARQTCGNDWFQSLSPPIFVEVSCILFVINILWDNIWIWSGRNFHCRVTHNLLVPTIISPAIYWDILNIVDDYDRMRQYLYFFGPDFSLFVWGSSKLSHNPNQTHSFKLPAIQSTEYSVRALWALADFSDCFSRFTIRVSFFLHSDIYSLSKMTPLPHGCIILHIDNESIDIPFFEKNTLRIMQAKGGLIDLFSPCHFPLQTHLVYVWVVAVTAINPTITNLSVSQTCLGFVSILRPDC